MGGTQTPQNLFLENCVFTLTCFNFLMQQTYEDFFPLLTAVFDLVDFDTFQCFCLFLLHLFHIGKTSPFKEFFHPETKKKSLWVRSGEQEGWGIGFMPFWSKTAQHLAWCGQVCSQIIHHEMGKQVERVFKKISLKPNTASHNITSWYTDTDGFLEYSPSCRSLYYKGTPPEDNSLFLRPPLYILTLNPLPFKASDLSPFSLLLSIVLKEPCLLSLLPQQ